MDTTQPKQDDPKYDAAANLADDGVAWDCRPAGTGAFAFPPSSITTRITGATIGHLRAVETHPELR